MRRLRSYSDTELAVFAELFTATNLAHLAWYGGTELLSCAGEALRCRNQLPPSGSLRQVLDAAFDVLVKNRPIEYVYKAYALERTIFGRYSPRTTAFYTEFPIANSRADILLVNGHATVYEIKTPLDDFARLDSQISSYYRCFSRTIVLTDEKRAEFAARQLPPYVGIGALTRRGNISPLREPIDFFDDLEHKALFALLHKAEYLLLGSQLGVAVEDVHPAALYGSCLAAFKTLGIRDAQADVIAALRRRQATEKIASLCSRLPRSLHAAAFSFRLPKRDWEAIIASQKNALVAK